ncbi:MAG TPA: hypothetical protein VIU12_34665 [Chryseolinea sp.]
MRLEFWCTDSPPVNVSSTRNGSKFKIFSGHVQFLNPYSFLNEDEPANEVTTKSIFAGEVLLENGSNGKYITKLRKELIEAPMFNEDKNVRTVNDIISFTVQTVKTVKEFAPGNKMTDPYFTLTGLFLATKGELILYENETSLAPKI